MTSSSLRSGNVSDDYQEESGLMESQNIEDRVMEAFDNLTAKSAKTRLVAFEYIRKNIADRCMIDFVYNRKITISDSIARSIKRNKGQDLGYAANLAAILCSIVGADPETDQIFAELIQSLLLLMDDQTIAAGIRASCAKSASICAFIIGMEGYFEQIMNRLLAIFSLSCAKGDGSMPNPSDQIGSLHAVCLQAWTLLLTSLDNVSPDVSLDLLDEYMDKVIELLDSPNLEIKLSAGETLAVMCEMIKSHDKDVVIDDFDELCDKLREIMTESQKSRGKKDIRQQKSNFREILAAIEEDETPSCIIKFGEERLVLGSWSRRRQYDAFCDLLGTGINNHLAENEVLRDIFDLGPVLVHLDLPKMKRADHSYENMMADKVRTKHMRKLRDKRADVID